MSNAEKLEGVVLIPEPARKSLSERQLVAYKNTRKNLIDWLAYEGKDPDALDGYSKDTYKVHASIICQFHRFVWDTEGSFTLDSTHDHANAFLRQRVRSDEYSDSYKHNIKLALKAYFRFKENEWEPQISISSASTVKKPKEYVTEEERKQLREAVLEYGSVPAYAALSPEKRDEWKYELARRFGKPVKQISQKDWKKANGYKYPTIVYASLDVGLRPVEVKRARVSWIDKDNPTISIPAHQSSKNEENWQVSIRDDTHEFLLRWIEERRLYEKYDGTDRLWLTRHGNPYSSSALTVLLDNLREIAGIERHLTWYAIRHSTGTFMAHHEGLSAAQSQLRHKRSETTMKYDNVSLKRRRDALDRMG